MDDVLNCAVDFPRGPQAAGAAVARPALWVVADVSVHGAARVCLELAHDFFRRRFRFHDDMDVCSADVCGVESPRLMTTDVLDGREDDCSGLRIQRDRAARHAPTLVRLS